MATKALDPVVKQKNEVTRKVEASKARIEKYKSAIEVEKQTIADLKSSIKK